MGAQLALISLLILLVTGICLYVFRCKVPWLKDQSFSKCSSPSPTVSQLSPSPRASTGTSSTGTSGTSGTSSTGTSGTSGTSSTRASTGTSGISSTGTSSTGTISTNDGSLPNGTILTNDIWFDYGFIQSSPTIQIETASSIKYPTTIAQAFNNMISQTTTYIAFDTLSSGQNYLVRSSELSGAPTGTSVTAPTDSSITKGKPGYSGGSHIYNKVGSINAQYKLNVAPNLYIYFMVGDTTKIVIFDITTGNKSKYNITLVSGTSNYNYVFSGILPDFSDVFGNVLKTYFGFTSSDGYFTITSDTSINDITSSSNSHPDRVNINISTSQPGGLPSFFSNLSYLIPILNPTFPITGTSGTSGTSGISSTGTSRNSGSY